MQRNTGGEGNLNSYVLVVNFVCKGSHDATLVFDVCEFMTLKRQETSLETVCYDAEDGS